jgi:hypothetical protein
MCFFWNFAVQQCRMLKLGDLTFWNFSWWRFSLRFEIWSLVRRLEATPTISATWRLNLICYTHTQFAVFLLKTWNRIMTFNGSSLTRNLALLKSVTGQFRWPRDLRYGSAAARLLGSGVRIPPRHVCLSFVSVVCCQAVVFAITRPEESYWVLCVWSWADWTLLSWQFAFSYDLPCLELAVMCKWAPRKLKLVHN